MSDPLSVAVSMSNSDGCHVTDSAPSMRLRLANGRLAAACRHGQRDLRAPGAIFDR
jgi:hypothetical protein